MKRSKELYTVQVNQTYKLNKKNNSMLGYKKITIEAMLVHSDGFPSALVGKTEYGFINLHKADLLDFFENYSFTAK